MERTLPANYYHGETFRGFSGSALKIFAITVMLIDHVAAAFYNTLFTSAETYTLMRMIGRIAFPIFAYMIAEGARRTHSTAKYLLRLAIFAVVSEVPFDHAFDFAERGQIIETGHQNVYFTLFLGLLSVRCFQIFKEKTKYYIPLSCLTLAACATAAFFLNTDYGEKGVLCIFIMYVFADKEKKLRIPAYIAAVFLLSVNIDGLNTIELFALPTLVFIFCYNGSKGIKLNKYFFYAFYPGHILLLYLIKLLVL